MHNSAKAARCGPPPATSCLSRFDSDGRAPSVSRIEPPGQRHRGSSDRPRRDQANDPLHKCPPDPFDRIILLGLRTSGRGPGTCFANRRRRPAPPARRRANPRSMGQTAHSEDDRIAEQQRRSRPRRADPVLFAPRCRFSGKSGDRRARPRATAPACPPGRAVRGRSRVSASRWRRVRSFRRGRARRGGWVRVRRHRGTAD